MECNRNEDPTDVAGSRILTRARRPRASIRPPIASSQDPRLPTWSCRVKQNRLKSGARAWVGLVRATTPCAPVMTNSISTSLIADPSHLVTHHQRRHYCLLHRQRQLLRQLHVSPPLFAQPLCFAGQQRGRHHYHWRTKPASDRHFALQLPQ